MRLKRWVYVIVLAATANAELLAQTTTSSTSFSLKVGDVSGITKLVLRKGKIDQLTTLLPNYTNLQILDLTKAGLQAFPAAICELPEITWLKLGNNDIDTVPDCICSLTKLTRLDLWDNNVFKLPDCLNDMPNLKVIDLNGMKYSFEEHDVLKEKFNKVKLILSAPCDCNFD